MFTKIITALMCISLLAVPASSWAFGLGLKAALLGGSARMVDINSYLTWDTSSYNFGSHDTGTNTDHTFILIGTEAEEISLAVTGTGYTLLSDTCGTDGGSSGGAQFDLLGVEP